MSAAIGSDTAGMSDDVALSDDTSPQPLLTTPHTREGYLILKQPPRSQPLTRSRDRLDHNAITNSAFMGTVGLDWQISGVGNFSSRPGDSDMIMRNTNTGGLQVYDIANNAITGSAFLGTVGLDWQFAGVAPVRGPGTSDLVLRNVNTGAFEAYNIANNELTGAASLGPIDLQWQLGGLAADPPAGAMGSAGGADANISQLCRRWRLSARAARATPRICSHSPTTRHSSSCWGRRGTREARRCIRLACRSRHGRACHRKSGSPDLRHFNSAELGQARVLVPSTSCLV